MSKFLMLIGLPASGKSTYAEDLKVNYDAEIVSSDALREELLGDVNSQSANTDIFEEMLRRTRSFLKEGKNVVYDATNISRKRRMGLLQQLKNCEKIAYYIHTPINLIEIRNRGRERVVPEDVILRMYKSLNIPIKEEGWDDIVFVKNFSAYKSTINKGKLEEFIMSGQTYYDLFEELFGLQVFKNIIDMPQDSKYHSFSVSRHTYYVYQYILENYITDNVQEKLEMLWAALLHDTGKYVCKSFENHKGEINRYANFIGHECVGSQLALDLLLSLGYDMGFTLNVSKLIQFHMVLLNAEEKGQDKLLNLVGKDMYRKLEFLRDADTEAH